MHEAKKWLAVAVCFVVIPAFGGVWFMIIRPLQTGVVTGGSKYRTPYCVLRSEDPARFRAHVRWNCVMVAAALALGFYLVVEFARDLQKARALTPSDMPTEHNSP